ncbi:MAG: sigma-70 family RNA polymerase sigma factor, partial [Actinobacteria bacterium]|nr:sigma-70 family RNA polymerase sigma factor [Actinomycetota bacterium]
MPVRREKAERLADEELMPWIGRKDAEAFEVFYDRHGGAAYSLAYRILGERGAAEDCIQEAFISIWRSGGKFDPTRGSVRSWTLSIVRNRAIDVLRSKAGKAPKMTFDDDEILESRPSDELTEEEAMRHETASEVRGALSQLPDDQSKVIQLAYFGGFSQSEIAAMLNVPLGT